MRQAGLLGAAGHYALDHNIDRLVFDHANAQLIAQGIHAISPNFVNPDHVDTNIIAIDLSTVKISAPELSSQLKEAGILSAALGKNFLRLVTHFDVSSEEIAQVNTILPELLQRAFMSK
jgi:threonine aldolase